jgi:hypothetical protein
MRNVIPVLFLIVGMDAVAADQAGGSTALITPITRESSVMGKKLRVEQAGETVTSGQGVVTTTHTEFLGHSGTLVEASVEAIPSEFTPSQKMISKQATTGTPDVTGTPGPTQTNNVELGRTDLYVGGIRLWTGALRYQNGALVYSGGVPPTQLPFTVFTYPIGPLLLQVDAGVEFEGDIEAALVPGLSYPFPDSTLDAKLTANLSAGGFIEGYANMWLIRGGVGGRVDLINGTTGLAGHIYMNGHKPSGTGFGMVHLLSGDLYGFVDTHFFFGRWNRLYKKEFYQWKGWCYAFGDSSCGI